MTFPEHVEDWYFFFNFNTSVLNSTSNVCKPAIYSASSRNKRKFRLPRRDPRETAEKRSLFADFEMSKYTHADVDFCGKKIKKKSIACLVRSDGMISREFWTWVIGNFNARMPNKGRLFVVVEVWWTYKPWVVFFT